METIRLTRRRPAALRRGNCPHSQALGQARQLINSSSGFLGVAAGKSSDHPGEGAVVLYVDENMALARRATVEGVRTLVIPSNAHAVVFGSAPQIPQESRFRLRCFSSGVGSPQPGLSHQAAGRSQHDEEQSAFFAVGVGQSLDNPKEAALDDLCWTARHVPADLPQIVNGLRTRYIVMDRMHVTRSYLSPIQSRSHCVSTQRRSACPGRGAWG